MNHKNYNAEKKYYRAKHGMLRGMNLETIVQNEQVSIDFLKEYGNKELPQKSGYCLVIDAYMSLHPLTEEIIELFPETVESFRFCVNFKTDILLYEKYADRLYNRRYILNHPDVRVEYVEDNFDSFEDPYDVLEKIEVSQAFFEKKLPELDLLQVLTSNKVSEEFVTSQFEKLSKKERETLISGRHFSFDFYKKFKDELNWKIISRDVVFTYEQQEELENYIFWQHYRGRKISPNIIRKNIRFFDMDKLAEKIILTEDIIEENIDYLNRYDLWRNQDLSEELLGRHPELIEWDSFYYKMHKIPENILWENRERLSYQYAAEYSLSERLMEYFIQDNYSSRHNMVANYQGFSMEFYNKHSSLLDIYDLNRNDKIDPKIKDVYNRKMKLKNMFKS